VTPALSIIIPVYREPLEVGRCLAYLASCPRIRECEIIVAEGDDGASMPPGDILPLRIVRSPAGRGVQLDAGARAARSDALLFLHVDTRPPRAFVAAVRRALASHAAGAFDLHIDSGHPIVRAISVVGMIRSRLTRGPYGDQVQFVRRDAYFSVDGFPHVPIMEDVALMDRMKRAGCSIAILRPPARTSGRRWEREGAVRTTLRNWRLMLAYRAGLSPATLRGRYKTHAELEPPRDYLVVFHRALRSTGVKTRLAADVGHQAAVRVYRAMLADLLSQSSLRAVRTLYFVDAPGRGVDYPGGSYPQSGASLWERMDDAFRRCFQAGARRVVLIGSDIPGIERSLLRSAFARLSRDQLVVGPSVDGGFYLLGYRRDGYDAGDLERASRGPERSAATVLEAARSSGRRASSLVALRDVDTLDDLRAVLAGPDLPAPTLRNEAGRLTDARRDASTA
jgi:rSAM/selenodomain-associated transferase 2